MTPARRLLAAASVLTVAGLAVTALAPASAAKAGTTLQGTVSWTTTVSTSTDVPGGDATTGTEVRKVTMKVKMTRRAGAASWQVEDNGSSYTGSYALNSQRLERDGGGTLDCTVTHAAAATAGGALPRKPKSTTPPALFSSIVPGTSSLGGRTKAIILTPILRFSGTDTTTYVGAGISPCQGGQDVDPIDGSLSPSNDARQICYPKGTSSKTATPTANDVVGAWSPSKKAFVFDCTKTWDAGNGQTVTTAISGALKLK
jgi:hypothetical protein